MGTNKHPLQNIHITVKEKPFKVIETCYKLNERTDKFDRGKIESRKTITYHAVLWRDFVFVREDGKHEYEALCGRSVRQRFGTDMEGSTRDFIDEPFQKKLSVEDKCLVIPSHINGKPVTCVRIDNCKSRYLICPTTVTEVWLLKCERLENLVGNVETVWIDGKNKLHDLRFMRDKGSVSSHTTQNGLKEILLACADEFSAFNMGIKDDYDTFPLLLDVYSLEKTPPEALNYFQLSNDRGNHVLGNTLKHGILHVPQGSKRYYQLAFGWKNFQNIEEFTQEEIDEKLAEYQREDDRILDEAYTLLKDKLFPSQNTAQNSQNQTRNVPNVPDCFERRGDRDLLYKLGLDVETRYNGGKAVVPTLTGQVRITIPSGTSSGALLRVKGKGIIDHRTNDVGDLYIQII